jgi:hypothetical protein
MKKLTLLILALLFIQITAISQPCLPEGITFTTQAQIDSFQTNYPNCTEIEGHVSIGGDNITNLLGLNVLTAINGYFHITGTSITNADGLNNLQTIGGSLYFGQGSEGGIWGNPNLQNFNGLNNLTTVGGTLQILNNDSLKSLAGLDNLISIGGLYIMGNDVLSSLTGLENLAIINSGANIGWTHAYGGYYNGNPSLTSFAALSNLSYIGTDFLIYGNPLTSLTGLHNLDSIGGDFTLSAYTITDLTGLANLKIIGGSLNIGWTFGGNASLVSLSGIENLTSIGGSLNIGCSSNPSLLSLDGIEGLTSIGGSLQIRNNQLLSNLEGLNNIDAGSIENLMITDNASLSECDVQVICEYLASPNGIVTIFNNAQGCNNSGEIAVNCGILDPCLPYGNYYFFNQTEIDNFQSNYPGCTDLMGDVHIEGENISNLNGLGVVTSIEGDLKIKYCKKLTSLTGFENLISIGGDLYIFSNDSLTVLSGLESLTSIGSFLNINSNQSLINLTGLNNLSIVGGYLVINKNHAMTTLSGLENLYSIDGSLYIGWYESAGNNSLTNLSGLDNLFNIGENFHIAQNNSLLSLSGLDNLNFIGGYLKISANESLSDLSGFNSLSSIAGYLMVYSNDALTSINGLNNLTFIGEDLEISNNASLNSLIGLANLESIEGSLNIHQNNALTSFIGLEGLTSLGGNLSITENTSLTNLLALDSLNSDSINSLTIHDNNLLGTCEAKSICDYLGSPNPWISIDDNAPGCNNQEQVELACEQNCLHEGITFYLQQQIDNFQTNYAGCINIGGDVTISGEDIFNLNGLSVITLIEGDLVISDNNNLTSLNGFGGLITIAGSLTIENNNSITSLWGLENIYPGSINDLTIINNPSLSICDIQNICEYLASPNGTVNIQNNATGCNSPEEIEDECNYHCLPEGINITTQAQIDSFQMNYPDCIDIEGDVWIHGNDITNLNGLNVVTYIGGKLRISWNPSLTSLSGINNVSFIGGGLEIYNNNYLTSLSGLESINSIGSNLRIESCHSLTTLTGLDNLNSVVGYVKIFHNDSLVSLEGLNNLASIGGYLSINNNDTLFSITGLNNVDAGSIHDLIIKNNSSLSACAVQSICDYLASPNGTIEIHDNAPGCNNQQEVEDACWTSVVEIGFDDKFTIIPNPLNSTTLIQYTLHQNSPVTLKILDLSGKEIVVLVNEVQKQGEQEVVFNTTGLPASIYFCILKTNEGIQTKKIIKM